MGAEQEGLGEQAKRLRDLPGVAEVEAMCRSSSYFDERNIRDTMGKIEAVSISLFCLSYYMTDYEYFEWDEGEERPSREHWETLLSNSMKPYAKTKPFWEALGWDITDDKGRELNCAHYFARQIIIAESGWIDGVQVTLDGSGSEPAYDVPEPSEDELEQRLLWEVQKFYTRRAA